MLDVGGASGWVGSNVGGALKGAGLRVGGAWEGVEPKEGKGVGRGGAYKGMWRGQKWAGLAGGRGLEGGWSLGRGGACEGVECDLGWGLKWAGLAGGRGLKWAGLGRRVGPEVGGAEEGAGSGWVRHGEGRSL